MLRTAFVGFGIVAMLLVYSLNPVIAWTGLAALLIQMVVKRRKATLSTTSLG